MYTPKWETPEESKLPIDGTLFSNDVIITNLNTTEDGEPDDGDTLTESLSKAFNKIGKLEKKNYDVDEIVNSLTESFVSKESYNQDIEGLMDLFVEKEDGKGLSSNDFTDEYKNKIIELSNNQSYESTSNDITVTNLNPNTENDEPDDGDTLTEVLSILMKRIGKIELRNYDVDSVVDALSDAFITTENADLTFVKKEDGKGLSSNDFTDEYKNKIIELSDSQSGKSDPTSNDIMVVNLNSTEDGEPDDGDSLTEVLSKVLNQIGIVKTKISNIDYISSDEADEKFAKKEDLNSFVISEDGKGLSSNDFTDAYKEKIDNFSNSAKDIIITNINSTIDGEIDDGDSLPEFASKVVRDLEKINSDVKSIGGISDGTIENLNNLINRVDDFVVKEDGKGLSSNDFTDADKENIEIIPKLKTKLGNLNSNNITLSNFNTNISGDIDDGDSLSKVISIICRNINFLYSKTDGVENNVSNDVLEARLKSFVKASDTQGLSTNDFTDEYKNKLDVVLEDGIDSNEVYVVNINPNTNQELIDNGDSLTQALSVIMRDIGVLRLKDSDLENIINGFTYITPESLENTLSNYVEKEDGKGLSSNDFTNDYKNLLDNPPDVKSGNIIVNIGAVTNPSIDIENGDNLSKVVTEIVNELGDIKQGIGSGESITSITNKYYYSKQEIEDTLKNYVEKEDGKGLSSNDFSSFYKDILDKYTDKDNQEILLNTNNITVVNTTEVGEQDKIHNGDTVSEAISKLMYADRLLNFTLRDSYLTRGQIELEYVHKRDGYDLSSNDFTDEYKEKIDALTSNGENSYFYNKEYIDSHFVQIEEGKGLSTNDFTNEYKDAVETLDSTYLRLDGGDMKGNINMDNNNITFTGGKIEFLRDGEVYSYLDSENYLGVADEAKHVGNLESIQRSTEYSVGDVVFTTGLDSGLYLYCTKSGITAVLEPVWATSSKQRTVDGTTEWQTRILGMAYNEQGEEIGGQYLPLAGGVMSGSIDMSDNDLLVKDSNAISFYNEANNSGTLTATQYSGNAATASKLYPGFNINGIHIDGSKDVSLSYIPSEEKGEVNGVATLDSSGRVPASQLPSFVRSVVPVESYDKLPNPGDKEIIYVTEDDNRIYRFTGTSYVEVSSSSSISDSALSLEVPRLIRLIGDVTGEVKFDGSKDVAIDTSLAETEVTPGTYNTDETIHQITVLADGRIQEMGPELVIAPKFANLKDKPNTLAGFGIIDGSQKDHKHVVADITNFPDSMKANGGNSDTVGGHYPGTNPGNVLVLDGNGYIPITSIPPEGVFSKGMVVQWYGNASDVPSGWAICDGTNGTPDLRDRFVVGAGGSYAKGSTGGEAQHTLTQNEMPYHKHDGSQTNSANFNGTFKAAFRQDKAYATGVFSGYMEHGNDWGSGNAANHTAVITFNGGHVHTLNVAGSGGGQPHNNMPPYVALFYIMKL